jgi:hypothetical protein
MAEIDKHFSTAEVNADTVTALTMAQLWDVLERIDQTIIATEMRRDAVLREITRHRTSFAAALRARLEEPKHPVIETQPAWETPS